MGILTQEVFQCLWVGSLRMVPRCDYEFMMLVEAPGIQWEKLRQSSSKFPVIRLLFAGM